MKIIILSLTVGVLIIGIHQSMINGIANSYWIFMFAVVGLLAYQYLNRYGKAEADEEEDAPAEKASAPSKPVAKTRKKIKKIGQ